jgi:hypothetical protein
MHYRYDKNLLFRLVIAAMQYDTIYVRRRKDCEVRILQDRLPVLQLTRLPHELFEGKNGFSSMFVLGSNTPPHCALRDLQMARSRCAPRVPVSEGVG